MPFDSVLYQIELKGLSLLSNCPYFFVTEKNDDGVVIMTKREVKMALMKRPY